MEFILLLLLFFSLSFLLLSYLALLNLGWWSLRFDYHLAKNTKRELSKPNLNHFIQELWIRPSKEGITYVSSSCRYPLAVVVTYLQVSLFLFVIEKTSEPFRFNFVNIAFTYIKANSFTSEFIIDIVQNPFNLITHLQ